MYLICISPLIASFGVTAWQLLGAPDAVVGLLIGVGIGLPLAVLIRHGRCAS